MTNNTSSKNPVPNFYRASAADFKKIPGSPIAYWVSKSLRSLFDHTKISGICDTRLGMATANNNQFLRLWHEVGKSSFSADVTSREEAMESKLRWFPYQKGGEYKKWYGNLEFLVNWENDGYDIQNFINPETGKVRSHNYNLDYIFNEGVTWNALTSSKTSARISRNSLFDNAGSSLFASDTNLHYLILAYINSNLIINLIELISPTLNYQPGDIAKLPAFFDIEYKLNIIENTSSLITIAKSDWDSYETSWDFITFPLLQSKFHQPTLHETYTKLRVHWKEMTLEMQRLEEENNRIFIEAYGLQEELTPDVPLSEVTLTCNPYYRYNGDRSEEELEALLLTDTIKEFISYAVGCMFGRYSLDKPGLVLANQGEKIKDYLEQVPEPSFMPDADNIIPILEDEYFEDDIVGRFKEFLKVTFGEDTLSENLDFIAEALGSNGKKSSEAVIRDYFLKSFYKDHVKMYKKRPIYWLFSSGKGRAFNALIYMHRYNNETLAMMRTDYLLELEGKLDAKREMIQSDIGKDAQEKARLGKMIDEMMAYDELLKNKADEYIEIDLDDGVKTNYAKFEGLVEKI
jgi:type II restriction/modification system DNA methylase subunit YeeA